LNASELEELKSQLAAFGASEADAQAIEPALRTRRRAMAQALLDGDVGALPAGHAGALGEAIRLLADCGLRDLQRDAEDERLAARIRDALARDPADPAAVLAAVPLLQAFEVPLPPSLERVAEWLLPDYVRFIVSMPRVFHAIGDAGRYHDFAVQAVELIEAYVSAGQSPLAHRVCETYVSECRYVQIYFNEHNLKKLYRTRARILERYALAIGATLAHTFGPRNPADARLRVGILAQHLGPQTETYFMAAHFEHLPREHCTLTLYALRDEPRTPLSAYVRSLADATVDLPAHPLEAARRIRADDLDVLVIGTNVTVGATDLTFLSLFRLARCQVTSGSSPVTSGFTSADWYLDAEENDTQGRADTDYTEQVYRMPGMLSRYAYHLDKDPQTIKIDRSDLGIPRDALLFMSAANYFKIIPEFSAALARVLARVPGAWLLLMPFNQNWSSSYLSAPLTERILRHVAEAGADPDRVLIMPSVPTRADLHAVMSLADVYLDSFPFPGACSLLDPMLVALPIVARSGRTFRSDVGAAMLRGSGLGEMAMASEEAYVERAVALARDATLRKQASSRIQERLTPHNPILDTETASRNMAGALRDMAARHEAAAAALARQSPSALRGAIERLAESLSRRANPWFSALTDLELGRQILQPYFQFLPVEERTRHMIDVGACLGQVSEPFLASGWTADLFEPDSACEPHLRALELRYADRAHVHRLAVTESAGETLSYYRSATGLSGLSPSPFGATEATVQVPGTRLDDFCRQRGVHAVDLLKVDAEGWDFDVLWSHDFERLPPRLAMVEFGTEFARQTMEAVLSAIERMKHNGYEALVFSYEDDGNFKRQIWKYRLIAAAFGAPVRRKDGHIGGNIVFFRRDDVFFLTMLLRVFLGFLPARERQEFLPT
jgi:FkbM family methyltransferase